MRNKERLITELTGQIAKMDRLRGELNNPKFDMFLSSIRTSSVMVRAYIKEDIMEENVLIDEISDLLIRNELFEKLIDKIEEKKNA